MRELLGRMKARKNRKKDAVTSSGKRYARRAGEIAVQRCERRNQD